MKVNINSVHFKTDSKLEEFIREKIEKLSSVFDNILSSEVTLKLDNNEKKKNKISEIKLNIPGNELFVSKQSKSFEESFDNAVEALRKQLKKHKEKMRKK
ncbi:MAG: ribosome-associated translation inhibitor RaiA [Bacteroidales bacterium]|nr:ribosome-associated translation inhibitor RaiA [Bacteroidales bacterium]